MWMSVWRHAVWSAGGSVLQTRGGKSTRCVSSVGSLGDPMNGRGSCSGRGLVVGGSMNILVAQTNLGGSYNGPYHSQQRTHTAGGKTAW